MKKNPRFAKLRSRLTECGYDQDEFARGIGVCRTYVNLRMNGVREWELEDMYKSLEFLGIPHSELQTYFPRYGGMSERRAS